MRRTNHSSTTSSDNKKAHTSSNAGAKRRIRLWMGFMIVFLGWAGYTFINQSGEIRAKAEQLEGRKTIRDAATSNLNQLKYEIYRLQDPEYIGQLAMKKYGLYKPGEIPVRVTESTTDGN